jgi:hypothetical protein
MALNRTLPPEERIKTLRADIDAFIDARVAEIRKTHTELPDTVVRQSLTRGMGCLCAAYLEIKAKDDEQTARETANRQ